MCCKSIKTCGNENHQIQDGGNLWQEERGMELGKAPRDLLLCHSVLFKNRNCSQFLQNVRIQQSWDTGILFTILFCLQVTGCPPALWLIPHVTWGKSSPSLGLGCLICRMRGLDQIV